MERADDQLAVLFRREAGNICAWLARLLGPARLDLIEGRHDGAAFFFGEDSCFTYRPCPGAVEREFLQKQPPVEAPRAREFIK